jgi:HPt (histidine-containing phosphotransfer) domain-containing protein
VPILLFLREIQNGIVHAPDQNLVLDHKQLHEITMDDEDLMREVLTALLDDTGRQLVLLDSAIHRHDTQNCIRLAHYCKGACANVGANRAAATLKQIELDATRGKFARCSAGLEVLQVDIEQLRQEAAGL